MADSESQAEEVRIGSQDLERRSEFLTQFLLVIRRAQCLPPSLRELVSKFVEQLVRECPDEVITVPEMLVERGTPDTSLLCDNARGDTALATAQDQSPSSAEQAFAGLLLRLPAADGPGRGWSPSGSGSFARHRANSSNWMNEAALSKSIRREYYRRILAKETDAGIDVAVSERQDESLHKYLHEIGRLSL